VTDEPEVLHKQVLSMVTDTKRVYKTQPGHPRTCNVCAFYKFFFDDWEHTGTCAGRRRSAVTTRRSCWPIA